MSTVKISTGFVKGEVKKDINEKEFYSFEGIRYAEPPLGELRFKAAVPAQPWLGVKNADSQGNRCYSVDFIPINNPETTEKFQFDIGGVEDCLFLNVFTPELPHDNDNLKPVMVFIHGGAYTMGSTDPYGPEVLVTEDIVLVTIQYRLGALGFLAFDEPELGVTGNAGMKDMILALKWVQENVKVFNGDPKNVTIFGESAGASSVHYLMISPLAKGLFHKAIMMSGCVLSPFAKGVPNNGIELAKHLGYTDTNGKNILKYLQGLSVEEIFQAQQSILKKSNYFAPIIEHSGCQEPFLTEEPIDLISSGKYNHVPLILGYCRNESDLFAFMPKEIMERITLSWIDPVVPNLLNLEASSEEYNKVAEKIKKFYVEGKSDELVGLRELATDNVFVRGLIQSAKYHSKSSEEPVYLYRLSVVTKLAYISDGQVDSVFHGDDLGYIFKFEKTPEVQPGSIEDLSRQKFTKLFTNFAKNGNPNPTKKSSLFPIAWKPVKDGEVELLDINETLTIDTNPEGERMKFWDEFYQSYPHANKY